MKCCAMPNGSCKQCGPHGACGRHIAMLLGLVLGYVHVLGSTRVLIAELWAFYTVIFMAWEKYILQPSRLNLIQRLTKNKKRI